MPVNRPTEREVERRMSIRGQLRRELNAQARLSDLDLSLWLLERKTPGDLRPCVRRYNLPEAYIAARLRVVSAYLLLEAL